MRFLAWFLAIAVIVGAAAADDAWRVPVDWSWLQYGKTTCAEVIARAGAPAYRSKQKLLRGVLDIRLNGAGASLDQSSSADGARPAFIDVEILGYGEGAPVDDQDRLVFYQDRLLYIVVLPPKEEQTVTGIEERYGTGRPLVTWLPRGTSFDAYEVHAYDADRIAFARRKKKNAGDYSKKIRWAPKSSAPAGLEDLEWKLPENPHPFRNEK